ncbi:hypothetical protein OsJ_20115 [Oryza sativa Japonica Group]|nr:hypothetical protein OsJ_20115 [Oryza sativa Japonica Group]
MVLKITGFGGCGGGSGGRRTRVGDGGRRRRWPPVGFSFCSRAAAASVRRHAEAGRGRRGLGRGGGGGSPDNYTSCTRRRRISACVAAELGVDLTKVAAGTRARSSSAFLAAAQEQAACCSGAVPIDAEAAMDLVLMAARLMPAREKGLGGGRMNCRRGKGFFHGRIWNFYECCVREVTGGQAPTPTALAPRVFLAARGFDRARLRVALLGDERPSLVPVPHDTSDKILRGAPVAPVHGGALLE